MEGISAHESAIQNSKNDIHESAAIAQHGIIQHGTRSMNAIRVHFPFDLAKRAPELEVLAFRISDPTSKVSLRRRFHSPSGLTELSRVHLVLEGTNIDLLLFLNGTPIQLGSTRPAVLDDAALAVASVKCQFIADVTPLLRPFNEMVVTIGRGLESTGGMSMDSACLEIHEPLTAQSTTA